MVLCRLHSSNSMPHLDFTVNVPTLIVVFGMLAKGWTFLNRLEYKINTMWIQFLIDHPEYERRETLKIGQQS